MLIIGDLCLVLVGFLRFDGHSDIKYNYNVLQYVPFAYVNVELISVDSGVNWLLARVILKHVPMLCYNDIYNYPVSLAVMANTSFDIPLSYNRAGECITARRPEIAPGLDIGLDSLSAVGATAAVISAMHGKG